MDILSIQNMFQNLGITDLNANQTASIDEKMDFSSVFMGITTTQQVANEVSVPAATTDKVVRVDDSGRSKVNFKENTVKDDAVSSELSEDQTKEIVEFKDDVIAKVSEICEVDEDTVEQAMEELVLTIMDLLNPQNLAQLVMKVTESNDAMSLLMSEEFSNLMEEINVLLTDLSESLGVNSEEMKELLSNFDFSQTTELELDTEMNFEQLFTKDSIETVDSSAVISEEVVNDLKVEFSTVENQDEATAEVKEVLVQSSKDEDKTILQNSSEKQNVEANENDVKTTVVVEDKRDTSSDRNEHSDNLFANQHSEAEVNTQTTSVEPTTFADSYTSVDPISLLEQITQNLKVTLQSDATTMEMQLNPENLGKVFIQVSSKQGVVSAQIAASNEAVKEVLETQMADLRQNLSQQGIKVDAIEVTVSSHGFERNLDDSEKRQEQEAMMQEEKKNSRRSLRLDSLDELVGLMSEEEMLVAQMMRDNGNSMDLTA